MKYGVDIGATRLDDLDKRVLARVKEILGQGRVPQVLDVGCGVGGLAVALAVEGAKVIALDIDNYKNEIEALLLEKGLPGEFVHFVQSSIVNWRSPIETRYDVVVLQRVLHYLPYQTAKLLLSELRSQTDSIFLSVTGATTAIAKHYKVISQPIEERFGTLDEEGQRLFSITAPLCIYTEEEIINLLQTAGWQIEWSRVSDFGNVKVVAS